MWKKKRERHLTPEVAHAWVGAPSPETSAKTPAIAVQPALLDGLVEDQDLAAEADLLDGVGPVAGDADHAWCLAALGDGLDDLGVAGDIGDVEATNVRGSLAAPQLQLDGAVGDRVVAVGGRVVGAATVHPVAWRGAVLAGAWHWRNSHDEAAVSVVPCAGHEGGRALDGLGWALAGQQALVWLVDALRRVHAVRDVHGHHVEGAALGAVHVEAGIGLLVEALGGLGILVDGDCAGGREGGERVALLLGLGGVGGGLDVLGDGLLGERLALVLGDRLDGGLDVACGLERGRGLLVDGGERVALGLGGSGGNRDGLNRLDGAERRLGLEGVEALGRDGGAVD